jgi:hypothetical protein
MSPKKVLEFKQVTSRQLALTKLNDITNFLEEKTDSKDSAIDAYYTTVGNLINLSGKNDFLTNNEMGPLILLGLCSATENYFRRIVAEVLMFCPISKKTASEQQIRLGSVLFYKDHRQLNAGIYEHLSFTNVETIKNISYKYLNLQISKDNALFSALEEFDKICELRHCVAHSSNYIYGKNAIKLDIKSSDGIFKLKLGLPEIHNCAAICNMLVATYNSELFKHMVERFYKEIVFNDNFLKSDTSQRKERFKKLWIIFFSKIDSDENRLFNNSKRAWTSFFKNCEKIYL